MCSAFGGSAFPDTSWGLVLATGDPATQHAAFGALCRRYWRPVYVSLRRQGYAAADAEDLTQGFFLHLIEHATVAHADRGRGRFRNFLLGALRRFLSGDREREQTRKRGGDRHFVEIDVSELESHLPAHDETLSLDLQFDRQWARTVIEHSLAALHEEYAHGGQGKVYAALKPCLDPGAGLPDYGELARHLARNEGAVKVAVHRLRGRFRDVLRREVARTVTDAHEVDAELAHLRDVLAAEAAQ